MSRRRGIFRANLTMLTLNEAGSLSSNEASILENIIYYKDSGALEQRAANNLEREEGRGGFSRLFKAQFGGVEKVFAGGKGMIYDIASKKEYILDGKSSVESVIAIGNQLFCACGDKLYMVDSFERVVLLNSFFIGLALDELIALNGALSSIAFFKNVLYFADSQGVGYFDTNLSEKAYLNKSLKKARLFAGTDILFLIEGNSIYKLDGANFIRVGEVRNASLYSSAYSSSLVGLEYSKSGITSFLLFSSKTGSEIIIKSLIGFNIFLEALVSGEAEAKIISSKNKLYFAFSHKVEEAYYGSLYKVSISSSSVVLGDRVCENVKLGDSPISAVASFADSELLLSFGNGNLKAFDFSGSEVHYFGSVEGSAGSACEASEGFYYANSNMLFKASENKRESKVTSLAFQNGRLIASIGTTLYYSAIGSFADWDIGKSEANAALFLEVGYKDESEIVEVAPLSADLLCFLKNGKVYRVSGAFPSWQVAFLGSTPEIISKPFHLGSTLIFATSSGIRALAPSDAYGDYIISNYKTNKLVDDSNITHIFLSDRLSTIFYLSNKRVLAESLLIGALSTFKRGHFIAGAEAGGQTYFISTEGELFRLTNTNVSHIEIGLNDKSVGNCLLKKIRLKLKENGAKFSEINLKISFKAENGFVEVPILKEVTHIKKMLPELSFKISTNSQAQLDSIELELG